MNLVLKKEYQTYREELNMEQIENKLENFSELSYEEKEEFVRDLIHSGAAGISAAFYNPKTQERMDINGLIEQVGEEKAIEILIKALDSKETEKIALSHENIKALIEKLERGECTDEERELLKFIAEESGEHNEIQFSKNYLKDSLGFLKFVQDEIGYNFTVCDLISSNHVIITVSSILSGKGELSKYEPSDISTILSMCNDISTDIYDTWKASCTSLPDPELIVSSLLFLAGKIAYENDLVVSNVNDIADVLNTSLDDDEDCSEEENGSNEQENVCQSKTHSSEDKEMRDLLKE